MRAWHAEHGRPPTATTWARSTDEHPSYRQVAATVGWPEALREAGLPFRGSRLEWTSDAMVEAIREWARRYGHPPAAEDWEQAAPGRPTTRAVVHAIGWATALHLAGFGPSTAPLTADELRELEVRRTHGTARRRV